LALFVAVALASFFLDNYGLILSYLAPVIQPMEKFLPLNRPFVSIPIACIAYVVMLGWPQVVFAMIGGFLFRRFKITITPR
jgi:hypothetical protein